VNHDVNGVFYFGSATAASADIVLATTQVIILWKRQTGFKKTDTVLRTLILYSVNTCALTCVINITCLVTFASLQSSPSLVYVAFYHQLPTLLFNALLATYNTRQELRSAVAGYGEAVTVPLSVLPTAPDLERYFAATDSGDRVIQISVDRSQDTKVDSIPAEPSIDTSVDTKTDNGK